MQATERQLQALSRLGITPGPRPRPQDLDLDDPADLDELDPEERLREVRKARERLEQRRRDLTMVEAGAVHELHRQGQSFRGIASRAGFSRGHALYLYGLISGSRSIGY